MDEKTLKRKQYHKQYQIENKERIKEVIKTYTLKNIEKLKEKRKEYYQKNKKKILKKVKNYSKKNIEKIRKYQREYKREKLKTDFSLRLINNTRRRINQVVEKEYKKNSSVYLLGCTGGFYKSYLESLFQEGMNWDNWGKRSGFDKYWEIDHIVPCCSFNLTNESEQLNCFNYKNTRPIWHHEHKLKLSDDINGKFK